MVLVAVVAVAVAFGYIEHRMDASAADVSIAAVDPADVTLKPAPIRADWILDGAPRAASAEIARSHDGLTRVMVWRVGAGRFNWVYDFDESVTILDGEVYLTEGLDAAAGNPKERRLGPGSVVVFRVGSTATWRVPDHVRKIATIKYRLPKALASAMRWMGSLRRFTLQASRAEAAL